MASRCRLPVSYTHLDVYKRQALYCLMNCVELPNATLYYSRNWVLTTWSSTHSLICSSQTSISRERWLAVHVANTWSILRRNPRFSYESRILGEVVPASAWHRTCHRVFINKILYKLIKNMVVPHLYHHMLWLSYKCCCLWAEPPAATMVVCERVILVKQSLRPLRWLIEEEEDVYKRQI